jgi:hypothetical protein
MQKLMEYHSFPKTQTSADGGPMIQKRGSGVPWLATVAVSLQTA